MDNFNIEKLLNAMPLSVYWKDKNGVYLDCNLVQALFFGFQSPVDIIGKTDIQLARGQKAAKSWMENDQQTIRSGTPLIVEETGEINNQKFTKLSFKIPFKDDSGNTAGVMGISVDITAQKTLEKNLYQEKKNAQIALENIIARLPGHVYWMDKSNKFLGCNDLQAQSAGLSHRNDIVGKTNREMPWFELSDTLEALNNKVMSTGKEHVEEQVAKLADGTEKTFLSRKAPLFDENNDIVGVLGISFDITDRKKMEEELIQAKNAAEASNCAKTEFLANMSHDVKTPMTGVVSTADLMRSNPKWCTPEKADIIYSSGEQVLKFFNSCLELSKFDTSEWASKEEEFSLKVLLEEIYALFLPRAESKYLTLTIDYDRNLPETLIGHRGSVYRVLLNLVGNALKFTEKGGVKVHIFLAEKVNEKNICVGIEVKDTGIGIPKDKQKIIFEKLRRLTPSYEGKIEGSGIGLYIVDQYVKRMSGTIQVESELKKGSTLTVLLPMALASEIFQPEKQSFAHSTISTVRDKSLLENSSRILLVEDNEMVQVITKTLLNDAGFQVDIAGTGAEAIGAFSVGKYGLIYMDIGLPDIDGYAVTHAIREKEKLAHAKTTPVVALTGHGAIEVQALCEKAGMQGILSKPIKREQIEDVWKFFGERRAISVSGLTLIYTDS